MQSKNAEGFIREFRKEVKQADQRFTAWYKYVLARVARRVPELTPVDTGRLKSNWDMNRYGLLSGTEWRTTRRGGPWSGTSSREAKRYSTLSTEPGKHTVSPISSMLKFITRLEKIETVYLVNQTPYASFNEFGTSKMAPRAMIERTFNELRSLKTIDNVGFKYLRKPK